MGNSAHSQLSEIVRRHGIPSVDYILARRNERNIRLKTKDEIQRLMDHADLEQSQQIELISQEQRKLEQALTDARNEAETHRKGSVQQAEAKSKTTVHQFSGYNAELKRLDNLERQVRERHTAERAKVQVSVQQQLKTAIDQTSLKNLSEYDNKSENIKMKIEEECAKNYPSRVTKTNTIDLERSLNWQNYKGQFQKILDRSQLYSSTEEARNRIKNNIVPNQTAICC